jgi:plastocyanin
MGNAWLRSLVGIVALYLITGAPVTAKPTPAAKCLSAKLKAVAKKTTAKLACEAKAVQKGRPVDAACLGKAETAFAKALAKAESKGGCSTVSDAGALEASVDTFVQSVVGALPDGGTKDGGRCAGAKRKANGKYASAELLCHANAASKAVGVDPECIEKGEASFVKAFGKAEKKGGCATVGDVGNLDETTDDFVDEVLSQLSPPPSTTTTVVTTSTTTSPAPSTTTTVVTPGTTTTTMGHSVATVMVGGGNGFMFVPATVTIKVGDTVHWTWVSGGHNVVSGQPGVADGKFCSPGNTNCGSFQLSDVGATYDHTFTEAGTYAYYCVPHYIAPLSMVGTIVVQP